MSAKPEPGWYADPADASRHRFWDGTSWTAKTRSATTPILLDDSSRPERSKPWLWVALAVLVLAGIGGAIALLREDPNPDSTQGPIDAVGHPTPTPTTDPSEVVVPDGWNLYTSETGVMSYAVDPNWLNLLGPGDQGLLQDWYSDVPNARVEYSGAWLLTPESVDNEGVFLNIITYSDGTAPGLMRVLARGYIDSSSYEDFEIVIDEEYTNGRGYPGWRVDYTGTYGDIPYQESVIALRSGTTVIYIYGSSDQGFESLTEDMLAIADSIVLHHPPA